MNLDLKAIVSLLSASIAFNFIMLSMSFNNSYRVLSARYTKCWQEFYYTKLHAGKNKNLDVSVIDNAKSEAFWMSLTFNTTFYFLLNIVMNYFVLASFAPFVYFF
ncbi:MAG: hypothetical protein MHMPM18_001603 [Marteilia pararefringens]